MKPAITGRTVVAGVAGQPVAHSLSPLIHNAWLEAAGLDGAYVAFAPPADRFGAFADGLRGGAIRGLNVTIPFKEVALSIADRVSARAEAAAAANLILFEPEGGIVADNTDGLGMLGAMAAQAQYDPKAGRAVVFGAGGAARGAAAALIAAGAPEVLILNRTLAKAELVAGAMGAGARALPLERAAEAFAEASAIVNATSAGLAGDGGLDVPLTAAPAGCVVLDMVYKPLVTPFLAQARAAGLKTVDGLEMLIRQAAPSFEAFYGQPPPAEVDVRALALKALGQ